MKKYFTQALRTLVVIIMICCLSNEGRATAWTTSTAGMVNVLANWTNGTSAPTTFATTGDTWTVTLSMTLGTGVVWTVGTVSLPPDTLILATGGTIAVGGIPTIPPVIDIYGVFMLSGGTLTMGGTAASEIVNIYGNTFISAGTINTPASSAHLFINTNGNFTMSGGSVGTNGSGASVTLNTYGNFNMAGGIVNTPAAGAYDTVNVHGNFIMTSGNFAANGAGCVFRTNIYGNCSISGIAQMTCIPGNTNNLHFALPTSSGTMLLDNTSTAPWSNTNAWIDSNCTAQLDGNFSTTMGGAAYGLTVNGTLICPALYNINGSDKFTLNGRGTLIVGHGTGINAALLTTGTISLNDTANYGFNGAIAQVTGTMLPASLYAPDTVIINNSTGVTLTQSTSTTGTLLFMGGVLSTGAFTMTVPGAAANVYGAGITSYVNGTLVKTITGYTAVNYEVGDLSYAPMMLTLNTAGTAGSLALKAINGLHPSVATSGLSSTHIYNHYWTITNNSAAGPATVIPKVTCILADILGGSNGYFVTQKYAGSAWLGSPLATTSTVSPYTSAPNTGITLATLAGDYIFGRVLGTLNTNAVAEAKNTELKIFPNPNTGAFTMNILSENNEEVHVVITNAIGETVKDFMATTNNATNITLNQAAGIYLLSAYTAHGRNVAKVLVK